MNLGRARGKCLAFVAAHPGGYRHKAMFGWRYYFEAPELKRAPFRVATIEGLIESGHLTTRSAGWLTENIYLTAAGRAVLTGRP